MSEFAWRALGVKSAFEDLPPDSDEWPERSLLADWRQGTAMARRHVVAAVLAAEPEGGGGCRTTVSDAVVWRCFSFSMKLVSDWSTCETGGAVTGSAMSSAILTASTCIVTNHRVRGLMMPDVSCTCVSNVGRKRVVCRDGEVGPTCSLSKSSRWAFLQTGQAYVADLETEESSEMAESSALPGFPSFPAAASCPSL